MTAIAPVLQTVTSVVTTALDILLQSTYFSWALLLVIVAVIGSVISGLIDIAMMIAQYGAVVLVILGILEFVAPNLLTAIVDIAPI